MDIHSDLIRLGKTLGVALAIGLDVLAVSMGVGLTKIAFAVRLRLGLGFATSEIVLAALFTAERLI